jgi:hypothetical protein
VATCWLSTLGWPWGGLKQPSRSWPSASGLRRTCASGSGRTSRRSGSGSQWDGNAPRLRCRHPIRWLRVSPWVQRAMFSPAMTASRPAAPLELAPAGVARNVSNSLAYFLSLFPTLPAAHGHEVRHGHAPEYRGATARRHGPRASRSLSASVLLACSAPTPSRSRLSLSASPRRAARTRPRRGCGWTRPGTLDTPAIRTFATAVQLTVKRSEDEARRLAG